MTGAGGIRIGTLADANILNGPVERRRELAARAIEAGIDQFFAADHVSFHTGFGIDGLIQAALVTSLHPRAHMCIGVYLLALRHPVPVARQLVTLAESAPGRFTLGIGVGGEDRHEFEVCGVDPATRGRRTDEMLELLGRLLSSEAIDHEGEFFSLQAARIRPAPEVPIPIVVGGRSPAALHRTARFASGWIGIWSTPERYREAVQRVEAEALELGRRNVPWEHGLQLWAAVDDDRAVARARLAKRMQSMYRLPFEKFERFSPYGTAEQVAEQLLPYVAAGCRFFNIMNVAPSTEQGIDQTAEIAAALRAAL